MSSDPSICFSDVRGIVAALDHVMERNMAKVSQNISIIQDQIQKEHRYEWATGVLVYAGVLIILVLTMGAYCVCLYRGMKGQYDMNLALRGQTINTLSFTNPLNNGNHPSEEFSKSRDTRRSLPITPTKEAVDRRASLLLPGGIPSGPRRGSRSSRHSSRRASDCGSDSDESVIISMN